MGKKKVRIFILALIPALVLVLLAVQAFQHSAAYYYTISEAKSLGSSAQKLRIKGQVLKDTVRYDPAIPLAEFTLTDRQAQIGVVYEGVLPDNFHHAQEVIVEGTFDSRGQFSVSKLMLQCPSKYEGEE